MNERILIGDTMQRCRKQYPLGRIARFQKTHPVLYGAALLIKLYAECTFSDNWKEQMRAPLLWAAAQATRLTLCTLQCFRAGWLRRYRQSQVSGQIAGPRIRRRTVAR